MHPEFVSTSFNLGKQAGRKPEGIKSCQSLTFSRHPEPGHQFNENRTCSRPKGRDRRVNASECDQACRRNRMLRRCPTGGPLRDVGTMLITVQVIVFRADARPSLGGVCLLTRRLARSIRHTSCVLSSKSRALLRCRKMVRRGSAPRRPAPWAGGAPPRPMSRPRRSRQRPNRCWCQSKRPPGPPDLWPSPAATP